ncbi:methyltransferase [Pararhizobium sp. DWP1-1-3]|uniref:methyltransferase n=1 Tax=Pararhizobium sp. DWP1-1-3 TaxID=2804652 RepID=UPI003CF66F96
MASESAIPEPTLIQSLQASIAPAFAMHAGVILGVFTALGDATLTGAEVARTLNVDPRRLERLLYALVSAGLLESCDTGFCNGPEAATYLVQGKPGYIGEEHQLLDELWRADLLTATSIREERPAAKHDFATSDPEASLAFFRGTAPSALSFGRRLADMIDFEGVHSAIDIGGGPGHSLIGLRETKPDLQVTLLELPASIMLAKTLLADEPLANGVRFEAGSIVEAPSSTTHDLAILKAVIQVLSREDAAKTIRNTYASLNSAGRILISGVGILNDDRVSPSEAVFYDLTFMNLYPEGASYTRREYRDWLSEAGFVDIAFDAMPSGSQLISARKP